MYNYENCMFGGSNFSVYVHILNILRNVYRRKLADVNLPAVLY